MEGKGDGLFGDGFAVWLTKERIEMGPVFGNRDNFEGLGIFFDTYANSRQAVRTYTPLFVMLQALLFYSYQRRESANFELISFFYAVS